MDYNTQNNCTLSGVEVDTLVQQYGSPLYVYDVDRITHQFTKMTNSFKLFPHKIHFAVKALTNVSIVKHLGKLGCGVDAVSAGEIQVALKAGVPAENIIFTPSGPSQYALDLAYKLGVMITLDSLSSLRYWGENYVDKPCAIRINPHVLAGGDDKISVAGIDSKFGISMNFIDQIMEIVNEYGIIVEGLHIHTGSDISNGNDYFDAVDRLITVSSQFQDLTFLDFGSGFKLRYHKPNSPTDNETDLDNYADMLKQRWESIKEKEGKELEFRFEPGKYLVGDAGYFITTANVVKEGPVCTFVSVNSGLNHLIRPMMYSKAYHKITNVSNPEGELKKYNVVGYICETDTFGTDRMLNEVRAGDHIVLHNAGAYCFTMASNYNMRERPAEVAVRSGVHKLITKRETFEDMVKNQIDVDFDTEEDNIQIAI
jgi:diaminopimelate decarboxylase